MRTGIHRAFIVNGILLLALATSCQSVQSSANVGGDATSSLLLGRSLGKGLGNESFTHDSAGRVSKAYWKPEENPTDSSNYKTFTYNQDGQVIKAVGYPERVTEQFIYGGNQLIQISVSDSTGKFLVDYALTRSREGYITQIQTRSHDQSYCHNYMTQFTLDSHHCLRRLVVTDFTWGGKVVADREYMTIDSKHKFPGLTNWPFDLVWDPSTYFSSEPADSYLPAAQRRVHLATALGDWNKPAPYKLAMDATIHTTYNGEGYLTQQIIRNRINDTADTITYQYGKGL
jgi:hypothetical protein